MAPEIAISGPPRDNGNVSEYPRAPSSLSQPLMTPRDMTTDVRINILLIDRLASNCPGSTADLSAATPYIRYYYNI
jgi:hypothetical protein